MIIPFQAYFEMNQTLMKEKAWEELSKKENRKHSWVMIIAEERFLHLGIGCRTNRSEQRAEGDFSGWESSTPEIPTIACHRLQFLLVDR